MGPNNQADHLGLRRSRFHFPAACFRPYAGSEARPSAIWDWWPPVLPQAAAPSVSHAAMLPSDS